MNKCANFRKPAGSLGMQMGQPMQDAHAPDCVTILPRIVTNQIQIISNKDSLAIFVRIERRIDVNPPVYSGNRDIQRAELLQKRTIGRHNQDEGLPIIRFLAGPEREGPDRPALLQAE